MITEITRQMSFEDIKPKRKIRYQQILDRLCCGHKTAKEVAVELYELGYIPSTERNYTAPRLTELLQMGFVEVIGKEKCKYTGKMVAIYRISQLGFEAINMGHIPTI